MCSPSWTLLLLPFVMISAPQVFPGGSEVKASACNVRDLGSIPGSGSSPGEGNGNPLQYSCLENPMDRGAWWATDHGVVKSRAWLSDLTYYCFPGALGVKNLPTSAGEKKRRRFDPLVRKIPWRREWQLTPVFLPGESHGWGAWRASVHGIARVGHDLATKPPPPPPPPLQQNTKKIKFLHSRGLAEGKQNSFH